MIKPDKKATIAMSVPIPTDVMAMLNEVPVKRINDRPNDTLRELTLYRGVNKHAAGSVLVCFGGTKVLVTASIEERVPRHIYVSNQECGWLTAEYSLLPGSTNTRAQRDRMKVSGRTLEIQRLIGRSLRGAIDLTTIGQRTITIDADVLQADGGTRVASITGGYVALAEAVNYLVANKMVKQQPKLTQVAAVSVGLCHNQILLDLNYEEDSMASVDANVVMNANGEFIEFQATAESAPYSLEQMTGMAELAKQGISQILAAQNQCLTNPPAGENGLAIGLTQ